MMTLDSLPTLLGEKADDVLFQDIIALIDSLYDFTETTFRNGDLDNQAGENNGSCKVLAFAQLQKLSSQETLACFGQYYREVLADAEGDGHQNIRNFMNSGWDGVKFESAPLKAK